MGVKPIKRRFWGKVTVAVSFDIALPGELEGDHTEEQIDELFEHWANEAELVLRNIGGQGYGLTVEENHGVNPTKTEWHLSGATIDEIKLESEV